MPEDCPHPETWIAWAEGRLDPEVRAPLGSHLSSCVSCRKDLAALGLAPPAPPSPEAFRRWRALLPLRRRTWVPYAAAAAVLVLAGGWTLRSTGGRSSRSSLSSHPIPAGPIVSEARLPQPGVLSSSASLQEWVLGPTSEAALAPLSRGGLSQDGRFRLEEGRAWVESSGDPIRISLAGWDGALEVSDGAVGLAVRPARVSFQMGEAWAGEESWGITVVRGNVKAGDRILSAGESLGSGAPKEDFRGWKALPKAEGAFRDSARALQEAGVPPSYTAEFMVRKKQVEAEGALRFRAGGKAWEFLLGEQMPSSGWVRVRLEVSPARVRLLAGGRECLAAAPERLGALIYPSDAGEALAVRAWGGDLELKEVRWRP